MVGEREIGVVVVAFKDRLTGSDSSISRGSNIKWNIRNIFIFLFTFSPLMERLYRTGEASRLLGVHPIS